MSLAAAISASRRDKQRWEPLEVARVVNQQGSAVGVRCMGQEWNRLASKRHGLSTSKHPCLCHAHSICTSDSALHLFLLFVPPVFISRVEKIDCPSARRGSVLTPLTSFLDPVYERTRFMTYHGILHTRNAKRRPRHSQWKFVDSSARSAGYNLGHHCARQTPVSRQISVVHGARYPAGPASIWGTNLPCSNVINFM